MTEWRSKAEFGSLHCRAEVYRLIRAFFFERGVLEVETPMLSQAGNTDTNIESFTVDFSGHASAGRPVRWLRTSPEFPLKRLLASGIGDCYELGRVFRNTEFGRRHNPEFTMLEWYRVGWDHQRLIDECLELVQSVFTLQQRTLHVQRTTYAHLFIQHIGLNPHTASDADLLEALLARVGIEPSGLARDDVLDVLLSHCIEPLFPADQLTVIVDFPASQCALAKLRDDGDIAVAERFELYIGGTELANGYHELTNASEQRQRFESDVAKRQCAGKTIPSMDMRLLAAMQHMPACAGVALGVDRLMMQLLGKSTLAEVIAFDFSAA